MGVKLFIVHSTGVNCKINEDRIISVITVKRLMHKIRRLYLRRWIAWISNIIEARRKCLSLSNKQKTNLRKIKRKYHVSSTSKLKEIKEKLHCRLRVVSSRERKAKLSREFNRENNQSVSSQKNWFKQEEN